MIPSIETCMRLMDQYEMLSHIKAHSLVVAKVAHLISKTLADQGIDVSIELATVGALLHDIGKSACLKSGRDRDHADVGRQICVANGFQEIADIVGEHVRLKNYHLDDAFSEKEIVFYSDKRVNHDQIVRLEDRQSYIMERYGKNQEKLCTAIQANFQFCKQVEEKLFRKMHFSIDALSIQAENEDIRTRIEEIPIHHVPSHDRKRAL